MATLLDAIKNPNAQLNPLLQSQTQALTSQLQAASGKAVSSPVAQQVNLGERIAQAQAREEEAKVVQEAAAKEAELARQQEQAELEADFQGKEITENYLNLKQQMQQKAETLMTEYFQGVKKIETARDQARVEVATFLMKLNNEKYINNLKVEGIKSRLENKAKFQEELQRSIWADEIDLLTSDLNFKRMLRADDRTFAREMADMDIETAIRLVADQNEATGYLRMFSGVAGLARAGIEGASTYKGKTNTELEKQYQEARTNPEATMGSSGTRRME